MSIEAAEGDRHMSDSQIFDLEHHRRLKALHTHLEEGATLSEAARLIGVSQMTAYRWNDHGRR
jgi:transposase